MFLINKVIKRIIFDIGAINNFILIDRNNNCLNIMVGNLFYGRYY